MPLVVGRGPSFTKTDLLPFIYENQITGPPSCPAKDRNRIWVFVWNKIWFYHLSLQHIISPYRGWNRHLVDLEMKLQMMSEEIAASLEDQSSAAILRVPRATRDVICLRDSVADILLKLKKKEKGTRSVGLRDIG
ncbi:hypothetical protein U1Q18_020479 [Sarracenia purpurea var. burkii]